MKISLKEFFSLRENNLPGMQGAKDISSNQFRTDMTNMTKNAVQQMQNTVKSNPGAKIKKVPGTQQEPAGSYAVVDDQGAVSTLDPTTGNLQKDAQAGSTKPTSTIQPTPPGTQMR
jgi:hypothetical protein